MSNNKKKDNKFGQIVFMIIMLMAGMACGGLVGKILGEIVKSGEKGFFEGLVVLLLAMYLAMFLQIVVHEAGHLVFGLLSGYEFSSFRIGSLMLLKSNGKLKLRKFSLAGTGGQCLMVPPELVDGKIPVVLFNLGGCIMNLITAILFAVIGYYGQENEILLVFSECMVIMGIAYALTNGIPLQMGPVRNDGGNALALGKNPAAMYAFWLQLKINEKQLQGVRLKDMPESWFAVPSDDDMQNGLVAATAVFHENWLMDQGRLEEALEYIENLLNKETAISGLYRSLLTCDRIYCELVVRKNTSEAIYLHNKEYEKFVKQMKNFPSIIRTEYTYTLLAEKDVKRAAEFLNRFDKMAKTYPYPNDILSERELIELVQEM